MERYINGAALVNDSIKEETTQIVGTERVSDKIQIVDVGNNHFLEAIQVQIHPLVCPLFINYFSIVFTTALISIQFCNPPADQEYFTVR